jgi:DNA helicase-2/ATP-dependent DNA helicase PcrA
MKITNTELNEEKQMAVLYEGDTIVIANPGTGKTLLLAYKYAFLLSKGVLPSEILCVTFTEKAKDELLERILSVVSEKISSGEITDVDITSIQVNTFHSFANKYVEMNSIVSSNYLRYIIYKYITDNEMIRQGNQYASENVAPGIDVKLRYIKSFGILPKDITNKENISKELQIIYDGLSESTQKTKTMEQLELFYDHFLKIFTLYEDKKNQKGIDFADMLISFSQLNNKKSYKWTLIDEMQDANTMQADIALSSAENFVTVGDPKQAIMGFQGGSVSNFTKFSSGKKFVLSENFRSTNEILDFAKSYYIDKTKDDGHKEELKNFSNPNAQKGNTPSIIYSEKTLATAATTAINLKKEGKKVAILTRSNANIEKLSHELDLRGVKHSKSYFNASESARGHIIAFLRAVYTYNTEDVLSTLLNPFFPTTIQEAFIELESENEKSKKAEETEEEYNLDMNTLLDRFSLFKNVRIKNSKITDIDRLFIHNIFPIAASYGLEYFSAAIKVLSSINESLETIENPRLNDILAYVATTDLIGNTVEADQDITIMTAHKSKGKEFDSVIFLPSNNKSSTSYSDIIAQAILESKGLYNAEENEEEQLRLEFVALTRAKKELYVVVKDTNKGSDFFIEGKSIKKYDTSQLTKDDLNFAKYKNAYNYFVNGDHDASQKILTDKKKWIVDFITNHFDNVSRLSYSRVSDISPANYLISKIISSSINSKSMNIGTWVHSCAEKIANGESIDELLEQHPEISEYVENVKELLSQEMKLYPKVYATELEFSVPIAEISDVITQEIELFGIIDLILENKDGKYLIIDWKTNKKTDESHKRQTLVYKKALARIKGIDEKDISCKVLYVGLKEPINDGLLKTNVSEGKPRFSAFESRVSNFLKWKNNPQLFIEDLRESLNKGLGKYELPYEELIKVVISIWDEETKQE